MVITMSCKFCDYQIHGMIDDKFVLLETSVQYHVFVGKSLRSLVVPNSVYQNRQLGYQTRLCVNFKSNRLEHGECSTMAILVDLGHLL
jgi:hypothetical protein